MRALVAVVAVAALSASATAGRRVSGIVLPTRRGDVAQLEALAARLAKAVARRVGGEVVAVAPSAELASRLQRARALALDAKLDEAAATYDLVLDTADRDPVQLDARELIAAHVTRAQIALARGETARAQALLERLVVWDGDFAPTADEATPVIHDALTHVQPQTAQDALVAEGVATACEHADTTIVVRTTRGGGLQIARFDGCTLAGALAMSSAPDERAVVDRLAPPARPRAQRSLLRRPLFWVVTSVVAGSAVGVFAWRETRNPNGYNVAFHF
jgi:hypothetical protein